MKTIFRFFTERHLLANALTAMILLAGGYSLLHINREEFPNMETGMIMVRASYPGASAEDVELQVTNNLEDALDDIVGIKRMSSTSRENSVFIRIDADEDADFDEVYAEVSDAIDGVGNLPDDVEPQVDQLNPSMFAIMNFGLSSQPLDYADLRAYAHDLEKKVLEIPGVAEVGLGGYRAREVRIEVSSADLVRYGLSLNTVAQAIEASNFRVAGGSLQMPDGEKNIITLARFDDPMDVGDVIVQSYDSGAVLRVKDIAEISDDFEEQSILRRINGRPAITFSVTKSANADIIHTADAVNALLDQEKASLPPGTVDFLITRDDSKNIRDKFNMVTINGTIGLTLVLLTLTAFLSVHTSIWVAMGIPISLMAVMIVLPIFNVELDSLTLSAMVLVIGIIVDDAIVIAENIFQHRERGEAPLEAAVNGLHEVAMPVFTTIATTVLAFVPMFFIKGMLGRFIYVIPLTVIAALTASLVESYFILPAHLMPGLHGGKRKRIGRAWFYPVRAAFERFLNRILPLRYVWLFAACLLLVGAVFYARSNLRFVLFARGGGTIDTIRLTLELPSGTPMETTLARTQELEQIIAQFPKTEIAAYESTVGSGGFRSAEGKQRATLTLHLPTASELTRTVEEINADVRAKTAHVEGLTTGRTWRGFSTGEAIEILVKSGTKDDRSRAVADVIAYLESLPGVSDLDRDDKVGNQEIVLYPNFALMKRYGLNASNISQSIRTLADGAVATTVRYGDEDIDFRVLLKDGGQVNSDTFKQIALTNNQGVAVNLEEVVDIETRAGLYALYHEDGEPTITVTGDVDEEVLTPLEVMEMVETHFDFQRMHNYPGVRLDIGGEAADSRQAQLDILISFALAAVGIYFLLMLLFESLTQPFVVLITIPFGAVGVVLAFILHGITQASFFAGIGLVGLAGVVVNDALVMVAHLNHLRTQYAKRDRPGDFDKVAIIAEGAANRLRPVILTTITTVVGLLPLTYGIGGQDEMMAPMAMALGYGLLFATPITLILLPCLYLIRDDMAVVLKRIVRSFSRKEPYLAENAPELDTPLLEE